MSSDPIAARPHGLPFWRQHPPFRDFPAELADALGAQFTLVEFKAGDAVFEKGQPTDSLVVIESGQLRGADGQPLLTTGAVVGTFELLSDCDAPVTLTAVTDSRLYRLSRQSYVDLAPQLPALTLALTAHVLPGLDHAQVAEIFNGHKKMGVPIPARALYSTQLHAVLARVFGQLTDSAIHQLENEIEWLALEAGETLFTQGEPGTTMCIVVNGRLRIVYRDSLDVDHTVGDVSAGDTIGEFALLTDELRSATVTAVRESNVVRLTRQAFFRLVDAYPEAMIAITQNMIRRQQRAQNVGVKERQTSALTVALIPIHGTLPEAFMQGLVACLEEHGSTIVLDADRIDREFGITGAANIDTDEPMSAVIAGWLSNLEKEYDTLVYISSADWSPWTRRCVRQVDRVYLVGYASEPPHMTRLERRIRDDAPTVTAELVLLHPPTTVRPSGTREWISQRTLRAHHHIRLNSLPHLRRLARRMTGNALGLVLSGGAARGFVHLGVIRALEELGVELDLIGGTSMGALLGATYLLNPTYEAVTSVTRRFASPRALFDYTLPLLSMMSSRKVSRVYKHIFGDAQIEDFWLPFFAISSNMSRAVQVIHTTGSARVAIRASTAIPGLFTPILVGNDVMVDGGLLDNFPLKPAHEMLGGGKLIGVLATPLKESMPFYDVREEYVSGWRILFNKLNPLAKRLNLPSMPGMIMRSSELSNVLRIRKALQEAGSDLILQIDTAGFGMLEFGAHDQLLEIGYQQAKPQIEAWLHGGKP